MFIGLPNSRLRALDRLTGRGPVVRPGLYIVAGQRRCVKCHSILAGGPGSGCTGPNCGRPAGLGGPTTSAGVMKQYGFKVLKKVNDLPHFKKQMGSPLIHTGTIYAHPKYGTMLVNHSGGFHHIQGVEKFQGPLGKFSSGLKTYMQKLTEGQAPTSAPASTPTAVKTSPPDGMANTYKTEMNTVYQYNDKNGLFEDQAGNGKLTPKDVQQAIDSGYMTPEPHPFYQKAVPRDGKPSALLPAGMAEKYEGKYSGDTYTYNPATGNYHNPGGQQKGITPEKIQKYRNIYTPVTPSAAEVLPEGLSKQYIGKNSGNTYTYNSENGKYEAENGKQIFPANVQNSKYFTPVSEKTSTSPFKQKGIVTPQVSTPAYQYKPPEVSTTHIPSTTGPNSNQLTFKQNGSSLGGAHEKYVFSDQKGNDWLFKPAVTLGGEKSPLMAHADEAVSKIAMAVRPEFSVAAKADVLSVPGTKYEAVPGKSLGALGSIQKMIPTDQLRGEGGKYKDFVGRDPNTLQPWEVAHLQQEQVLDWLISNHDAHAGQFLRVSSKFPNGRGVIGIDKSQAFKFLGNDKLSADYHPNTMEQEPLYNKMWAAVKSGKISFDPMDALPAIKNIEGISDADYKKTLAKYADSRFPDNGAAQDQFLNKAVARKNSIRADFEKFYSGLLGQDFKFEPVYDPNKTITVGDPSHSTDVFPLGSKPHPSADKIIAASLPALMKKYPGGTLREPDIDSWKYAAKQYGPKPTKAEYEKAAEGKGLYPELAAKAGVSPKTMSMMIDDIQSWKAATTSTGAGHIRQAAQDIMNGDCCKSEYSAAWQIEHAVTQAKLAKMHPEQTSLTLTRGLTGAVATDMKKAVKMGANINYRTRGAEGWTENTGTAKSFGSGGVVLKTNVPFANIITTHKTSPEAMSSHTGEKEVFVAFPKKTLNLHSTQILQAGAASVVSMASKKTVFIDGSDQAHTAIPPEWKRQYTPGIAPTVIEAKILKPRAKKKKKG